VIDPYDSQYKVYFLGLLLLSSLKINPHLCASMQQHGPLYCPSLKEALNYGVGVQRLAPFLLKKKQTNKQTITTTTN